MIIKEFTIDTIDQLEDDWTAIESGVEMTVFQSFKWYKWLNSTIKDEKLKNQFRKVRYLAAYDEGKIVMIAPLQLVKFGKSVAGIGVDKGVYFVGRLGLTDYLNFVYDEFNTQAVDEILDYIKETYCLSNFYFENVCENTSFSKYIKLKSGCQINHKVQCAALVLPESFDEYKDSLKKNAKQNIRTAINRQNRNGVNLTHQLVHETDTELNKILLEIRAQRLGDKQRRDVKKITSKVYNWFFVNVFNKKIFKMKIFDCLNDKWCFLVKHDDRVVGFFYGICDIEKGEYYAIIAGVDKEYAWYSPSISHMYQFVEELYGTQREIKVIDFTRGDERYKIDIGGTVKYNETLRFCL